MIRQFSRILIAVTLGAAIGASSVSFAQEPAPGAQGGESHGRGPGGGPRRACEADIKTLCAGVERGGGRIMLCLREHRDQLSESCKAALAHARGDRPRNDGAPPEGSPPQNPPSPNR
jgi:hypothetical protein